MGKEERRGEERRGEKKREGGEERGREGGKGRDGEEREREREAEAEARAAGVRRGGGETGGTYVCGCGCGCPLLGCVGASAWAGGAALERSERAREEAQASKQASKQAWEDKARQGRAGPRLCSQQPKASTASMPYAAAVGGQWAVAVRAVAR